MPPLSNYSAKKNIVVSWSLDILSSPTEKKRTASVTFEEKKKLRRFDVHKYVFLVFIYMSGILSRRSIRKYAHLVCESGGKKERGESFRGPRFIGGSSVPSEASRRAFREEKNRFA